MPTAKESSGKRKAQLESKKFDAKWERNNAMKSAGVWRKMGAGDLENIATERGIANQERLKKLDKLQGPGYKKGGKVTTKKKGK